MTQFKAVVFDWAGTTIDFGSFAPMGAFVETFAKFGVEVTIADARKPMGLPKRAHISQMLYEPHIGSRDAGNNCVSPGKRFEDRFNNRLYAVNNGAGFAACRRSRL